MNTTITITDQLNRTLSLSKKPTRIISLVPSLTELICYLGLESKLVGITKFCVHPKHLKSQKNIVGGTKNASISKIKALNPDLILCNKEENTLELVQKLQEVAPVHVSDIYNINDTVLLINQYGKLLDCETKAKALASKLINKTEEFKEFANQQKCLSVAYFIWYNPLMVAANNTFINYMLHVNNFKNCFQDLQRYPTVTPEIIKQANPEVIMLSSEPYPFKNKHIKIFQEMIPQAKILLVDGEYFSWYGSRLLTAFKYFKTLRESI